MKEVICWFHCTAARLAFIQAQAAPPLPSGCIDVVALRVQCYWWHPPEAAVDLASPLAETPNSSATAETPLRETGGRTPQALGLER